MAIEVQVICRMWDPIKISQRGPKISHLFFAEHFTLFARAKQKNCITISRLLDLFRLHSRQKVNLTKSKDLFSANFSRDNKIICRNLLHMAFTESFGKYLGFPMSHDRPTNHDFQFIMDNIKKRLAWWKTNLLNMSRLMVLAKATLGSIPNHVLAGWKANLLNMYGRVVFAKTTLGSIPNHVMQYIKLLSKITKTIVKIQIDFILGSSVERRKIHLVNWEIVTKTKEEGGLGLQQSELRNKAQLASHAWRDTKNSTSLWAKVLSKKYTPMHPSRAYTRRVSRTRTNMSNGKRDCSGTLGWSVHSSRKIYFFKD